MFKNWGDCLKFAYGSRLPQFTGVLNSEVTTEPTAWMSVINAGFVEGLVCFHYSVGLNSRCRDFN